MNVEHRYHTTRMPQSGAPTLADQQRFWDSHWQRWKERGKISEWNERRQEVVSAFLGSLFLHHPRILDVGCGPGWSTEKLGHFGQVVGLDLSEEAITIAKSRFPHLTFMAGNFCDYPLPAEHFDIVVSQEVIAHVEDQAGFLRRTAYVLKPRGYLILSCGNKFVMDRLAEGEFPPQPPEHISRYLGMKDLRRLLRPKFHLLRTKSILPVLGQRGILRLVNSYKLNAMASFVIPEKYLTALKEFAGLGYTVIVLAQKKS